VPRLVEGASAELGRVQRGAGHDFTRTLQQGRSLPVWCLCRMQPRLSSPLSAHPHPRSDSERWEAEEAGWSVCSHNY
jgi:hypothetical protein